MNALKQYIDLYKEHADLICLNSAEMMNGRREEAFRKLETMKLPRKGSENYETTDLEAMLAPDYGVNIARVPISVNPAASFHCGVPTLSTALFMMVNDLYAETPRSREGLPEGVWAGSLRKFAEEHPELMEKYYGRLASLDNPIAALDTLLAQDGIAVWVKKGVKVEKPLQIVNILQNGQPLMAVRRVLVIADEDSEVKILSCDHTQNPDIDFLALNTIEIYAGRNASVDYYDLEESTEKTSRLCALYLKQEEGSNVMIDGITLYNGNTRNEYRTVFAGPHASLRLYGMGIEDRHRHLDNYSHVVHGVTDCNTDELFKYVVDDEAVGAFAGLVLVRKGADRTEAYQSNRNLVGSDTARMYSKPQLEIYNDDVKCSHGTATGQLDDMQVFYMRTRGIPEAEARLLLKQAFMADVVEGVRLAPLRDRLHMLLERRFAGADPGCASCHTGCHSYQEEKQNE